VARLERLISKQVNNLVIGFAFVLYSGCIVPHVVVYKSQKRRKSFSEASLTLESHQTMLFLPAFHTKTKLTSKFQIRGDNCTCKAVTGLETKTDLEMSVNGD